jgi:enamine deaminase RidA (YjgF/YER057c/UK114 family)
MSFESRANELGYTIPELPRPAFNYVPAVRVGNLVFASGQTPKVANKMIFQGKLGRDVSIEQGQEAARLCLINCLAEVRSITGSLDTIVRIVKLNGYVASSEGFDEQPKVINGA